MSIRHQSGVLMKKIKTTKKTSSTRGVDWANREKDWQTVGDGFRAWNKDGFLEE